MGIEETVLQHMQPADPVEDLLHTFKPTILFDEAVMLAFSRVSPSLERRIVEYLQKFAEGHEGIVTVGSLASGSDLYVHVCLDSFTRYLDAVYDIKLAFVNEFAAENDLAARAHLMRLPNGPRYVFAELADVCKEKAKDCRSGDLVMVPWVAMLVTGPPCVSRSPANRKSSSMRHCVQSGAGKTGEHMSMVLGICQRQRPEVVIIENVTQLLEADETSPTTDGYYIKDELTRNTFGADHHNIEALQHGSPVPRNRYHCYAFDGVKEGHMEQVSGFFSSIVAALPMPPLAIGRCMINDEDERHNAMSAAGIKSWLRESTKHPKVGPDFRSTHMEYFKANAITWPPSYAARHEKLLR